MSRWKERARRALTVNGATTFTRRLLLSDVTAVETADSKAGADQHRSSTKQLAHCLPNIVFDVSPGLLGRGL
jgi:hypothetical protein